MRTLPFTALIAAICILGFIGGCRQESQPGGAAQTKTLRPIRTLEQWDEYRRLGLVPEKIDRVYCSGGTLRLVVYMECAHRVVAVDSNEQNSSSRSDMKAYLAAHPELRSLPLGGETSGRDNPELLLTLSCPPQLIIKADTNGGYDPDELTRRTGIPVLLLPMRDLTAGRREFDTALRLLGAALDKSDRAEDLIAFFDRQIAEIRERVQKSKIPQSTVYVGGVSFGGSHAFNSTEAGYSPFEIVRVKTPVSENADHPQLGKRHAMIAKEKILQWNPEMLFLDLGTLALGPVNGLSELRNDTAYRSLTAVRSGNLFAVLPKTCYFVNHDAVLANAWFIGKTLHPDQFEDVDPKTKADDIFTFLVGEPVFDILNADLNHLAFHRISLNE